MNTRPQRGGFGSASPPHLPGGLTRPAPLTSRRRLPPPLTSRRLSAFREGEGGEGEGGEVRGGVTLGGYPSCTSHEEGEGSIV